MCISLCWVCLTRRLNPTRRKRARTRMPTESEIAIYSALARAPLDLANQVIHCVRHPNFRSADVLCSSMLSMRNLVRRIMSKGFNISVEQYEVQACASPTSLTFQ